MPRPWVVIPTYNEKDNIARMIEALFSLDVQNLSVLIVDDNSPDGTSEIIKKLQERYKNLYLETRKRKSGLGRAYVHGFQYALDHGSTAIVQMDADFSHDPKDVPTLFRTLEHSDLVIGSRYINGISVVNWPLRRLILSTFANTYARVVTGLPYKDVTGGFRAWRAETMRAIDLQTIVADGYGFQIVIAYRTWKKGFSIKEVPIIFTERREGQSKMNKMIMWEAFWLVWRLRLFNQ